MSFRRERDEGIAGAELELFAATADEKLEDELGADESEDDELDDEAEGADVGKGSADAVGNERVWTTACLSFSSRSR